jgi:hypothetical protein
VGSGLVGEGDASGLQSCKCCWYGISVQCPENQVFAGYATRLLGYNISALMIHVRAEYDLAWAAIHTPTYL